MKWPWSSGFCRPLKYGLHQYLPQAQQYSVSLVMKLKNSNWDETQTQVVINLKSQILMKLHNSNCDETQNSNCDETPKLKL